MKVSDLKSKLMVASLAIVMVAATGAQGAQLLYLDARAPGGSPGTQWNDLSGVNQPLVANASQGGNPVYNPAGGPGGTYGPVYEFGRGAAVHWFETQGADEANFDFPHNAFGGGPNPAGEMTVVAYLDNTGFTNNTAFWSKGDGVSHHHQIDIFRQGGTDTILAEVGPTNQAGDRGLGLSTPAATDNQLDLLVVHFSGETLGSSYEVYFNGSNTNINGPFPGQNAGAAYAPTNDPLHIGSKLNTNEDNRFFGDIQFIEVYSGPTIDNALVSGMSPQDYSVWRAANLGIIPEPSTLLLVVVGGVLALCRRNR